MLFLFGSFTTQKQIDLFQTWDHVPPQLKNPPVTPMSLKGKAGVLRMVDKAWQNLAFLLFPL